MRKLMYVFILMMLFGCTGSPKLVEPVSEFNLERYLGTWYEVARLDHSFERGLNHVTATYSRREDGGVRVINRGYSPERKEWKEAEGKAYFIEEEAVGHLKVSFFGPFYGSYIIFELDEEYQYAFVSGPNTDYLWLLSRTPMIDKSIIQQFKVLAQSKGFDVGQLILVQQDTRVGESDE
ncbi:lipocalin family protein [Vibrio sp.]|nr:lipocalin family protein [Vibrio sp.]